MRNTHKCIFKTVALVSVLCLASGCATPRLSDDVEVVIKPGVYQLEGTSPGNLGGPYRGSIAIDRSGANYKLMWVIGRNQTQVGVGILESSILSVGYLDTKTRAFGVVSFRVLSPTHLRGKWAPLGSKSCGMEDLKYIKPLPKEKNNTAPPLKPGQLGAIRVSPDYRGIMKNWSPLQGKRSPALWS